MAKKKVPIPEDIAAEILFLCDFTCCKCNVRGKKVQIHHIDEKPDNYVIENLAPLCFDCHDETMTKGGFARHLNAPLVLKYRADWIERVINRRKHADELASIQTVTGTTQTHIVTESEEEDFLDYKTNDDAELLIDYLNKILIVHKAQRMIAQTKWDTGLWNTMDEGNSDMVDFYQGVLIELSTFYPKGHFNDQMPQKYFSGLITSKYQWQWFMLEPDGSGTRGRMVSILVGGSVMEELKQMIFDMATSLHEKYLSDEKLELVKWKNSWLN
jgi:hypothetical protein